MQNDIEGTSAGDSYNPNKSFSGYCLDSKRKLYSSIVKDSGNPSTTDPTPGGITDAIAFCEEQSARDKQVGLSYWRQEGKGEVDTYYRSIIQCHYAGPEFVPPPQDGGTQGPERLGEGPVVKGTLEPDVTCLPNQVCSYSIVAMQIINVVPNYRNRSLFTLFDGAVGFQHAIGCIHIYRRLDRKDFQANCNVCHAYS